MPLYKYQARDNKGQSVSGELSAAAPYQAAQELRESGLYIVSIREAGLSARPASKSRVDGTGAIRRPPVALPDKKPNSRDFMVFCRQFATAVEAGMTVLAALKILAVQTRPKSLAQKVQEVVTALEKGSTLADAFAEHGPFFPRILIHMVEAGELSGSLDITLKRLADYFEKEYDLREKVKSASTYPAVIMVVALLVVAFLIVRVLPMFAEMFSGMGAELPLITRMLMSLGTGAQRWWPFVLLTLVLTAFALRRYVRTTRGAYFLDRLKMRLPVLGPLYQKVVFARFSRTLATLLASGVGVLPALILVGRVSGNKIVEEAIAKSSTGIRQGQSMAAPLRTSGIFPPMLTEMLKIGEETGAIDTMMGKVADFYEADVAYAVSRLSAVIEPILILGVAVIVGTIVVAIVTPMFEIFQYIQ
jgi:type IV pilus assembly protein PilC